MNDLHRGLLSTQWYCAITPRLYTRQVCVSVSPSEPGGQQRSRAGPSPQLCGKVFSVPNCGLREWDTAHTLQRHTCAFASEPSCLRTTAQIEARHNSWFTSKLKRPPGALP